MQNLHTISEKLSNLINYSDVIIENIRQQNIWTASNLLKNFTRLLNDFFPLAAEVFEPAVLSNILPCIQNITDAQQRKDYVLLGDFIELDLLPSFYELQGMILSNIDPEISDYFQTNLNLPETHQVCDQKLISALQNWYQAHIISGNNSLASYTVEPTNSGYLTMSKTQGGQCYYLHSNSNPWKEARLFGKKQLCPNIYNYTVIGLGLSYHIIAMLMADARVKVTVLESDLNIIGLWLKSCTINYLINCKRFRLVYSPQLADLEQYTTDNTRLIIHYPSLISMEESPAKGALQKYYLHYSSVQEQKQSLDENFHYNQLRKDSPVDALKDIFKGKTVVYFGGGPSAETKLPYIRQYIEEHPDTITVCAGKVYRKLLQAGFTPDYMMITDPKASLVWQTKNISETKTELLYIATASRTAVDTFKGKHHISYQKDYEESENFANEHGYLLISTGGSVSTTAIDLILQLGCARLITTGLDLAYPEGKTHAFGIQGNTTENISYVTTHDVQGRQIKTSPTFQAYQEWIERRLSNINNVEFINITDGVKIQGMRNVEKL